MKRRLVIRNAGLGSQTEDHIIAWNMTLVNNPRLIRDRHFNRNGVWNRVLVIEHDGIKHRRYWVNGTLRLIGQEAA